jgi:hypothetical protein
MKKQNNKEMSGKENWEFTVMLLGIGKKYLK